MAATATQLLDEEEPVLTLGLNRNPVVLLVEPSIDLRAVLVEALREDGFRVRAYASAHEALAASAHRVDVMLVSVDFHRRGRNDDLASLQRDWRGRAVPIVVLALGDEVRQLPGVTRVLHKPIGLVALCAALRAHGANPAGRVDD